MKHATKRASLGTRFALAAVVLAGLIGAVLVGVGVRGEDPPPSPPASEAVGGPESPATTTPASSPQPTQPSGRGTAGKSTAARSPETAKPALLLKKSQPTRLSIPSIDVDTDLMNVGLQADGSIGVPPLQPDSPAGWYDRGPTPGEKGPAVILGHVTALNEEGPAVFFKLGALRMNDKISVTRADKKVAVFTVTRIVQTPKPDFSSLDTYGNTSDSQLRLITCGGTFNKSTGRHADNIVVHATLTSTHPA